MYDWAKFRQAKSAVKLHQLLDHDGCLPSYAVITDGKTHEIRMARALQLPAGAIVAMNRGYVDYTFLDSLTEQGVFFVTRLKDNAVFSFVGQFSAPRDNILADDLIDLPGSGKSHNPQRQRRRVAVWDEVGGRQIVLLTNNRKFSAATIAAIYDCLPDPPPLL
jgi:Transposase DDE domain